MFLEEAMLKKSLIILPLVFLLCFCFCTSTGPTKTLTIDMLKIQDNEISGWTTDQYGIYNSSNFQNIIDGGAYDYYAIPGFTEALYQTMKASGGTSGGYTLEARVIDFTTDSNAVLMYQDRKTLLSANEIDIPQYDNSVAFGLNSISGGIKVFAHFKRFYIELSFAGFPDLTTATQKAVQFLKLFDSKING
jgi:hypothetical protein